MTFKLDLTTILTLLGLFGVSTTSCVQTGCTSHNQSEMERAWTFVGEKIITPVAEKAIAETSTRTATLQGGAQVIEPGYEAEFEGYWVTGVKGKVLVKLVGVAGQITGHAQGDAGQAGVVQPPVIRTEAMKPEPVAVE